MIRTKRILILTTLFIGMQIMINVFTFADANITAEQAKAIALKTVNTDDVGAITSIEIEMEGGVKVYTVEFTKDGFETDVKINIKTGAVILIDSDKDKVTKD